MEPKWPQVHDADDDSLELLILFPSPPESWDCRSTLSQWGLSGVMEPRAPCILGKCSTNLATSSGQL